MSQSAAAQSVHEAFAATVAAYADRPLLHVPGTASSVYSQAPVELSYGEAAERVGGLVEAYRTAGYGPGHRVALMLENRPVFFLHFLSLNALGVSVVPIHHELLPDEMRYRLEHSDTSLLVTLPEHLDKALDASGQCESEVNVASCYDSPPHSAAPCVDTPISKTTEAAILYTSGTTGKPKGCLLSNDYFLLMGQWYLDQGGLCAVREGEERLITPLPVNHMNAMACSFMAMVMSAGCLIQLDRFHPSRWWEAVRESRATILHYLGVMPAILLGLPESEQDDLGGRIKFGFGAGVDPRHHQLFELRFGFPLIEGWAMTETGAGACVAANHEPRHTGSRCFGTPPAALEYRIVDEAGALVPSGKPGELLVRATGDDPRRGFFSGYYKDEAATEAAWEGGWFHTGDVVRLGADGSFHFVDRRKNIIRRSGENIAAVEVENALFRNALVDNCAVAPVPDEMRGEEVMACVVLASGAEANEDTAQDIVRESLDTLAYFKAPGYIAFVDALPMTPSQKVQRGELKTLCRRKISAGECHDTRGLKRRPRPARGRS